LKKHKTKKEKQLFLMSTHLDIIAEAIALDLAIFFGIQFQLELLGLGIPHDHATLAHQVGKLIHGDVQGQIGDVHLGVLRGIHFEPF